MINVNSLDIIKKLNTGYSIVKGEVTRLNTISRFENCLIRDDLKLDNTRIANSIIEFIDCNFQMKIEVISSGNVSHIKFQNCKFFQALSIQNSPPRILIRESIVHEIFNYDSRHSTQLIILNSTISKGLKLRGEIKGDLIIKNINEDISNLSSYLVFEKFTCQKFELIKSNFDKIEIGEQSVFGKEAFLDGVFTNSLTLNHVTIGLNFTINASILNEILFDNIEKNHRHINIINSRITSKASIALSMIEKLNIEEGTFEFLRLWGNHAKGSFISINKPTIRSLEFDSVYNEGAITLREIKPNTNSCLSIKSSNMGKTDFILCDFTKSQLDFENSKLTEIFIADSDFPNVIYNNKNINHKQGQLCFGQLQTAFQRQGDSVRMIEYQSREIESHYKTISWISSDFFHKLNLGLNKASNNFGRSWVRGILFSFAVGLIFFYLLIVSTKEYKIDFPLTAKSDLLISFFRFMNPLRFFELDNLFKNSENSSGLSLSAWSYIWDFFGRIFIAYGFYQTVQAFRKFGRK